MKKIHQPKAAPGGAVRRVRHLLLAGGATVTRSFDGFWHASSRLYAGILWSFDNEAGLTAGRGVGAYVADNLLRLKAERRAADPDQPVFPPVLFEVHGVDGADWAGGDGSNDGVLSRSAGLADGLLA